MAAVTRSYGVTLTRSAPLRLPMNPTAPDQGSFRRWMQDSERPVAVDLFCGAGGLSLGLEEAGYRVALAIDTDEWSLETHAHNFEGLALNLDLAEPGVRDAVVRLLDGIEVDLVAGGPPCQPYSRAGRSKIRSLVETGSRDALDHRRELWRAFLDVVERVQPRAVLMENVPDMALGDDATVLRHMLARLEVAGYETDARLLDTWLHGVPQHRQRLVVVGLRDGREFRWPDPSDRVTLRDAISDLPALDPDSDDLGAVELAYAGPQSDFQRRARKQCVGEKAQVVLDHVTRAVRPDDLEAFRLMRPGTLYSDLPERLRRYRADIFDDKYNRLAWDDLSRSITAHIAKDGYWYIHPDQHRTLTVREAARVQTFPDQFRFAGTRSHQFAQIGNAVPPAVGEAVGAALLEAVRREPSVDGATKSRWRADVRGRLVDWARTDRTEAPWAYPGDLWPAVVGQVMGGRGAIGWPSPADVLALAPTWREATPALLTALVAMADVGGRQTAARRLADIAAAVRADPAEWEGEAWRHLPGIGPAARDWVDLFVGGGGMVASTGVLRAAARLTASCIDRQNRLSHGRMELARLIGDGEIAATVNAALHRLGTTVCTADDPDCSRCPVLDLCRSAECRV
jgi:DNA (cytosine-5)-methyltransferase 1